MLYVNDTSHLDMMIERLNDVEGVVKVSRFQSPDANNVPGIINPKVEHPG
jgi:hypothetical protein